MSVYRNGPARVSTGVFVGVGVVLVLVLVAGGDRRGAAELAGWWTMLSALAYALFWRPEVRVDDRGVTLVNPVRDVRVGWGALRGVETRFALTLITDDARHTSWAAAAPGRPGGAFRPWRRPAPHSVDLPPSRTGSGDEPAAPASRRLDGDAGAAAFMVETAWETWRERTSRARTAGERDPGDAGDVGVTRHPAPGLAALAGMGLVGLSLLW